MNSLKKPDPKFEEICFGLDRQTDERSLALFLQLFSRDELLKALIPRLNDQEIIDLVDRLTNVLRAHLRDNEYHELFLADPDHHH